MLDFVAKAFRGLVSVVLVICLIGFAIGGAILFYNMFYSGGAAFGGFLLGGIIGLIFVILSGGFIANFLNMVDNIEKIALANGTSEYSNKNLPENGLDSNALKEGDILIVKREITLKDDFGPNGKETIRLKNNDLVKYIETINNIGLYPWYLVETENGERGYYVSLDFQKKS